MKIACFLFAAGLAFAADPPKATEKPEVHLTDAEKAQLYKALATAANDQSAAVQASQRARASADELTRLREQFEKKCGTVIDEEPGKLADCAKPKLAAK